MVVSIAGFESVQGRRATMEDTHVVLEDINKPFNINDGTTDRAYYAVYDGHGGKNAADMTAELLHKNIINDPCFVNGQVEQALKNGFALSDKLILGKAEADKWSHGTTTVVCVIIGNTLYIANTGDSEAVLATPKNNNTNNNSNNNNSEHQHHQHSGELTSTLLTEKHKPNEPSERKRIVDAGGHVVFGRVSGSLAVSRALGDMDFKYPYNKADGHFVSGEPYVNKLELSPSNPFLVIACDGLWDKVTYEEAVEFVANAKQQGKDPTETSQLLVKHALDLGSFDNITIIVVYLNWESTKS